MVASTRSLGRLLAPILAASAVCLSACGSGATGGEDQKAAAKYDSMSVSELADAAAREGSLTFYTTFADDELRPLAAAFNKRYPKVKLNALRLGAEDLPPRVLTEQRGGKHTADLVSGESTQLAQLLNMGALAPYTPKELPKLPTGLSLPAGYRGIAYATTTVIAYNPKTLKQKGLSAPTSWESLTEPGWRGQFSVDPNATNWYDSLIVAMGHDKALNLVKRLGANKPVLAESHTQSVTQVQSGEPAAAASAYGYKAASLKKATPGTLEFVNTKPMSASLNLLDVVKNAPHPAAARLFENWILSRPGQQAVVDDTGHQSIRTDVKNDPTVWDPERWKPAYCRAVLSSSDYNKEVKEMKSALHAP